MELHIDEELESFIKPLQQDEFEALSLAIQADGCLHNIIVWNHGDGSTDTIVDGHNRYRICQQFKTPFKTTRIKFSDKSEVMTWMYNHQKARRNLNITERLELYSKLQEHLQKHAEERRLSNLKQFSDTPEPSETSQSSERCTVHLDDVSNISKQGKTIEKLAKEADVSYKTAFKYDAIQRKGTDEQKEAVRSGKKKIGTVYKEIQAKEKPISKTQSNECDIEKLLKGKTIKTPYLLIYSQWDESNNEELQAELSNCQEGAKLKMCTDCIVDLVYDISNQSKISQFRSLAQKFASELMQKKADSEVS